MDVYEQDGVLFISKINQDKNKYFVQLISVTFGLITSASTYVPIKSRLLNKPIKLLHFPRIFHSTNGFNPEIAVRRITGNVMSFCQRTVTPGKPAEIVCWLCTACRNVYRHFNSIIPVNSPEQFEARIPEDTSCLCLRPHVPSLTSPLSIRQSPICRFLNIKVSYRFFFCTPYMTHGCAKKKKHVTQTAPVRRGYKVDTELEAYQFHFLPTTKTKKTISPLTVLVKLIKLSHFNIIQSCWNDQCSYTRRYKSDLIAVLSLRMSFKRRPHTHGQNCCKCITGS